MKMQRRRSGHEDDDDDAMAFADALPVGSPMSSSMSSLQQLADAEVPEQNSAKARDLDDASGDWDDDVDLAPGSPMSSSASDGSNRAADEGAVHAEEVGRLFETNGPRGDSRESLMRRPVAY
jgi:hypothetical protein